MKSGADTNIPLPLPSATAVRTQLLTSGVAFSTPRINTIACVGSVKNSGKSRIHACRGNIQKPGE